MRTIFKSYGMYDLKEIKEVKNDTVQFLKEEFPEEFEEEYPDDNRIYEHIMNNIQLEFEDDYRYNLNIELQNNIIAIADIGRWNGRVTGYKILSNNLHDILSSLGLDEIHVYSDGYNIRMDGYHHDGSTHVLFRLIRDNINIENLTNKIYNGDDITNRMLNYYTKSLAPYVNNIYGWGKRVAV